MPNLRAMMGRPLPAGDLSPGTVSVRVSEKLPMAGLPGVAVTASVTLPDGSPKSITLTTDENGRAFSLNLAPGATFIAQAVAKGETSGQPCGLPSRRGQVSLDCRWWAGEPPVAGGTPTAQAKTTAPKGGDGPRCIRCSIRRATHGGAKTATPQPEASRPVKFDLRTTCLPAPSS